MAFSLASDRNRLLQEPHSSGTDIEQAAFDGKFTGCNQIANDLTLLEDELAAAIDVRDCRVLEKIRRVL